MVGPMPYLKFSVAPGQPAATIDTNLGTDMAWLDAAPESDGGSTLYRIDMLAVPLWGSGPRFYRAFSAVRIANAGGGRVVMLYFNRLLITGLALIAVFLAVLFGLESHHPGRQYGDAVAVTALTILVFSLTLFGCYFRVRRRLTRPPAA